MLDKDNSAKLEAAVMERVAYDYKNQNPLSIQIVKLAVRAAIYVLQEYEKLNQSDLDK